MTVEQYGERIDVLERQVASLIAAFEAIIESVVVYGDTIDAGLDRASWKVDDAKKGM